MKMPSCAITASYKGCWIHQRTDGSFSWQTSDYSVVKAKSWRAAQLAITAWLKQQSI